jgi:hypothetical protein
VKPTRLESYNHKFLKFQSNFRLYFERSTNLGINVGLNMKRLSVELEDDDDFTGSFPSSGDLHCRRLHSSSAAALSVVPSRPSTIRVPAVLISCGPTWLKSCNRLIRRHAGSLRSAAVLLHSPPTKLSKSEELLLLLGKPRFAWLLG